MCPRPTPEWQKGIASFFQKNQGKENKTPDEGSGCSGSSSASASCQPSASNSSTSKSCAGTSSGSSSETKRFVFFFTFVVIIVYLILNVHDEHLHHKGCCVSVKANSVHFVFKFSFFPFIWTCIYRCVCGKLQYNLKRKVQSCS